MISDVQKGVFPTEYSDFISDIIALEHHAREVTREAREREAAFDDDVTQQIACLREDYLARAGRRLAKLSETETALADEAIAALDRQFAEAMRRVESAYEKNHDAWAGWLFEQITGDAV